MKSSIRTALCIAVGLYVSASAFAAEFVATGDLRIALDTRDQLERMQGVLRGDVRVLTPRGRRLTYSSRRIKQQNRANAQALRSLVNDTAALLDRGLRPATPPLGTSIEALQNPYYGMKAPNMRQLKAALDGIAASAELLRRAEASESDIDKILSELIGLAVSAAGPVGAFLNASRPSEISERQDKPGTRGPAVPPEHGGDRPEHGGPGCCVDYDPPDNSGRDPSHEGPITALIVMPQNLQATTRNVRNLPVTELERRVAAAKKAVGVPRF